MRVKEEDVVSEDVLDEDVVEENVVEEDVVEEDVEKEEVTCNTSWGNGVRSCSRQLQILQGFQVQNDV